MRVLVCPDKFRGTATALSAARAMADGARDAGWDPVVLPLADGGDGTLEVLGGANRSTIVTGPLGEPVEAAWRLDDGGAVIEMALASGLALAGGSARNDAMAATTRGTGELIVAAIEAGARRVLVGVGGSATTDGGAGALEVLAPFAPLDGSRGYTVVVACDVTTTFDEAAAVFAPQKGAGPSDVIALTRRLELLADEYALFGVDVRSLPHAGAAGGLAGGLAAIGAQLRPGFAVIADAVALDDALVGVDHVITGEGRLDDQSFEGKVVGGVIAAARAAGIPLTVIAGAVARHLTAPSQVAVIDLTQRVGAHTAMSRTTDLLRACATEILLSQRS